MVDDDGEVGVEELRERWKRLWREKVDDKVRAEGIASGEYPRLFVDRGTVIFATRDFRPLSFREILERHEVLDVDRYVPPSPKVGGWGKFIRAEISNGKSGRRRVEETRRFLEGKKKRQHQRKGGHGWLRV